MVSLNPYYYFFMYQFHMFHMFFTISAFFQDSVNIYYCKIQVTKHGVHYLLEYSWSYFYTKRESIEFGQIL